jgi:cell division septal protein FtsQ
MGTGRRPGGAAVRGFRGGGSRVRRSSAGLSRVRAGAALALLASAGGIYGLAATSAFGFARLEIQGAVVTSEAAVRDRIDLAAGQNLFVLSTEPLEDALADLPTLERVSVSVGLPDTVTVELVERVPILVWQAGERRYLVDPGGYLFADVEDGPPAEIGNLPVIGDARRASGRLGLRDTLDPVDLDAATRLAGVRPADVGSAAAALTVSITDENGFTLHSVPKSWFAVFGFYGSSQRTTEIVPGQVQLLERFLVGRESLVAVVILADAYEGTYIPKPSAEPDS